MESEEIMAFWEETKETETSLMEMDATLLFLERKEEQGRRKEQKSRHSLLQVKDRLENCPGPCVGGERERGYGTDSPPLRLMVSRGQTDVRSTSGVTRYLL